MDTPLVKFFGDISHPTVPVLITSPAVERAMAGSNINPRFVSFRDLKEKVPPNALKEQYDIISMCVEHAEDLKYIIGTSVVVPRIASMDFMEDEDNPDLVIERDLMPSRQDALGILEGAKLPSHSDTYIVEEGSTGSFRVVLEGGIIMAITNELQIRYMKQLKGDYPWKAAMALIAAQTYRRMDDVTNLPITFTGPLDRLLRESLDR